MSVSDNLHHRHFKQRRSAAFAVTVVTSAGRACRHGFTQASRLSAGAWLGFAALNVVEHSPTKRFALRPNRLTLHGKYQVPKTRKCCRPILKLTIRPRYDYLLTRSAINEIPDFEYCLNPACSSGQINTCKGDDEPKMTCYSCQQCYCVRCKSPWHEQASCDDYQLQQGEQAQRHAKNEKKTKAALQSFSKPCPECSRLTERHGGCAHMVCLFCGLEWCFACQNYWDAGHKEDCPEAGL